MPEFFEQTFDRIITPIVAEDVFYIYFLLLDYFGWDEINRNLTDKFLHPRKQSIHFLLTFFTLLTFCLFFFIQGGSTPIFFGGDPIAVRVYAMPFFKNIYICFFFFCEPRQHAHRDAFIYRPRERTPWMSEYKAAQWDERPTTLF
jgi:hypothetical protein